MSKQKKTINGCDFEIWEKSMRMVSPVVTPLVYSPEFMSTTGIPEKYATNIIETLNAGIELYISHQIESKAYRIGKHKDSILESGYQDIDGRIGHATLLCE